MLESVSTLTHLFPQLEEILFPIMHKMCSQEGQDVFEEVLQIISYCTYFCEEVRASFTTVAWAVSGHMGCLTACVALAEPVGCRKSAGSSVGSHNKHRKDALCKYLKHRQCSRQKAIKRSCSQHSKQGRFAGSACVGGKRMKPLEVSFSCRWVRSVGARR